MSKIASMNPPPLDNPRTVTRAEARQFANGKLCCSDCWGEVRATFKWNPETRQTEDTISCGTPNCPMHGFVTKRYVQSCEQNSLGEYLDAKAALRDAIPALRSNQTEKELLTSLGF